MAQQLIKTEVLPINFWLHFSYTKMNNYPINRQTCAAVAGLEICATSNKLSPQGGRSECCWRECITTVNRPPVKPTAGGNLRFQQSLKYLEVILQEIEGLGLIVTWRRQQTGRSGSLTHWLDLGISDSKLHPPVQGISMCAFAANGWARILR